MQISTSCQLRHQGDNLRLLQASTNQRDKAWMIQPREDPDLCQQVFHCILLDFGTHGGKQWGSPKQSGKKKVPKPVPKYEFWMQHDSDKSKIIQISPNWDGKKRKERVRSKRMGSQRLKLENCFVTGWAWLYMMAWWCNAFTTTPEPLYLAFWTVVCSPLLKSSPNSKSLKKIVLSAPNILATPSIVKASLKSHTGKAESEFCLDGLSLAGIAVDAVPTSLGKAEGSQGSLDSIRAQSRRRLSSSRFSSMARPRFRSSAVRLSASAQATMEFLSSKKVASGHGPWWPSNSNYSTIFHHIPPISIHQLRVWVCGSSSKAQRKCSKALWLRVGRDNSASASVSPDLPPVNRPKSVGHRRPFRCAGRDVFRIFPDVFFGVILYDIHTACINVRWSITVLIVSIRQTLWQLPTWPTSYSIMHWMACPGSLTCRRTFRISLSSTGSWISSTPRVRSLSCTIQYYQY